MADKKEVKIITLPEGRLIISNLFERSAYTDPKSGETGKPMFNVAVAFDKNDIFGEGKFEDDLANAAADEWGDAAFQEFLDDKITSPILSGDEKAAKQKEEGKPGDAYAGKFYIKAKTGFDGVGPGVDTYDEDANLIEIAERNKIYSGCYGRVAVQISTYKDNRGRKAMNLYLKAFQKTRDGEKLRAASADTSSLFKPVGRTETAGAPAARRSRKG